MNDATEYEKQIDKKNPYYISGDLIGRTGVENYYEEHLRGVKGQLQSRDRVL